MNLGKNITRLRKKRGLTQEQFASLLNVSVGAVSKWENDVNRPDIDMLPSIADVFQISVDVLLGYKKPHRMKEEVLKRAEECMKQSDYYGASKLLSDILVKYPNDYEIVKKLADAYYCITFSEQSKKKPKEVETRIMNANKAIYYLERSVDLYDEKLHPDDSIESISILMASVFGLKDISRYQDAIDIIEKYNREGKYDHLLSQVYFNSGRRDDAKRIILKHCVARQIFIFNDLTTLADMFYQEKDYITAAEILTAEAMSYELFMRKEGGYANRAYAAKAETIGSLYKKAGMGKKYGEWHRKAVVHARKYRKNPSMKLSSLRFCDDIQGQMVDNHDDLIESLCRERLSVRTGQGPR